MGVWENICRDKSGLVNRPFVAQTIPANKDLANVKPSPVAFDVFYRALEKKASDLNTIQLLKLVKCLLIINGQIPLHREIVKGKEKNT